MSRKTAPSLFFTLALACGAAEAGMPAVIFPGGQRSEPAWTTEELSKETAVRLLEKTEHASHHWLRTTVSEKPHVHDRSDLTSVLLAGRARMHVGAEVYELRPGDVAHIPKGVPHWLELLDKGPARAYVIFSPPFDPSDRRFID